MTEAPLVSCVMPTRDRRAFARQAIRYFLRQDHPAKELIVVDDGDDAIEDLTRGDERIRYVRSPRSDVGAKRNLGCQVAAGEFVAQWDDDDWISYNRLSAQVAELTAAGADVHTCRELLHYRVDAGDAWLLRPRWPDAPDLPPGPLLCRRSLMAEHPFAASGSGEQRTFAAGLARERVHVGDASWYLAVVHRANLAGRSLDDGRWTARPFGDVTTRLGTDERFYADLRNGIGPQKRPQARAGADLTLAAPFRVWDGYGLMAEYLALGMQRAGASVAIAPHAVDHAGLTEEMRDLLAGGLPIGEPILWFAQPDGVAGAFPHARDVFINTMWEADQLPRGWAEPMSAARAAIAPTRFVADVFRRSGVRSPIEVVPQGADPQRYPYVERPPRPGLTTLVVATLSGRKHPAEAVAAWQQAFAGDPDARLILKGKLGVDFPVADPRIQVITDTESTRGIAHWYEQADILLALGNEGFGLPVVEGMATGLTVVALHSEGQGDVCADAGPLVLDVPPARWEPADDTHYGPGGVRGVPDVDAAAARLRWVAEHRDEARDLGRQASAWAHRERNVWDMGPAMLDVMERHLHRPLRRARTLWTAGPENLGPYVSALAANLGGVRIATGPPDVAGLTLLHVQHSGDSHPPARIAEAANRVPVIVTEHAVTDRIGPWERDATALVATTSADADALRRRWPGKWVEWIPYGCPPPVTARTRGPVPGAVAVIGHLPAAADAARGRRRRVLQLEPGQHAQPDLARMLADDCDLVVFADAAAARLDLGAALAANVPVLAPPDPRLADVAEAILQDADIAAGTVRVLDDADLRQALTARAHDYCTDHSWQRAAQRHLALWTALETT
jgi:glycosyltransferase involved in cell wall biosynthesis